ncbi:NAD(P)-dependent dehydrogenase, short-chain alcohol dehydrogenase family [Mycobacterium rhizamassiliense]|uniref:NAD(P)-dependent dehydrogenase, short-chain alcohol dehydrogenase family n=1 Tax=Mycobacterium rhizamassiliense TaxID=1841860 RepID=A0A2U3NLD1_9MYCO|nr:NAD(P)-dependent dehydrogenase, short-chain alcohol dehydrogenase family [Mycobacterium rhizamassiliense]
MNSLSNVSASVGRTAATYAHTVDELFGLTGKVAVVTGAAGGIGLGIARVLANAGATVALADKDHAEAMRQAADIAAAGHDAVAVAVDLADENSVVAACAQIVGTVGVPWLLVNNAALQDRELLLEATTSEWDKIHTVNARGAFLMTRESARAMVASGRGGRIVNIASNALRGGLIKGLVSYASSKGALAALSLATAFELAEHSITVNTILPGAVITPGAINAKGSISDGPATRQTPFGYQEPHEIGAAVLFFASPAARPITNQVLAIDGGFSVS